MFSNLIENLAQICIAAGVNSFDAKYLQVIILHFHVVYLSCPQCVNAFRLYMLTTTPSMSIKNCILLQWIKPQAPTANQWYGKVYQV